MRNTFLTVATALTFAFAMFGMTQDASAERCWSCKSDSTGSCSGADQCQGDRADCTKAGCKIGGSHTCKSAGNITTCKASFFNGDLVPIFNSCDQLEPPTYELGSGDCFMCSKSDSSGDCSGAEQCKGTRKSCRDAGCKITGTRSCSTAANVKTCSASVFNPDASELSCN